VIQALNQGRLAIQWHRISGVAWKPRFAQLNSPHIQAIHQHKLWQKLTSQTTARPPHRPTEAAIPLKLQSQRSPVLQWREASWTNNLSGGGLRQRAGANEPLSARFHQVFDPWLRGILRGQNPPYQKALPRCCCWKPAVFRYWGQGVWTELRSARFTAW